MIRALLALCTLAAAWAGAATGAPDGAPGEAADSRIAAPASPLPFYYDLYTFRGERGQTLVVAAFAVPVEGLERERYGEHVRYRFDVSLVVADTVLRTVYRTDDSVYVAALRPLADEHLLYTHSQVLTPPSKSTVHRVIVTDAGRPGVGQLYHARFSVPDYRGSELMISDIALGQPDATRGWTRGEVTLALLPTSHFPETSFDVYYEVYNLPFGRRYATEIAVEPIRSAAAADHEEPLRLRFTGESAADRRGTLQELRRVQGSLPTGEYRLTVTITDEETGRTATGSQRFEVRGWTPGATMVAALPRRTFLHR